MTSTFRRTLLTALVAGLVGVSSMAGFAATSSAKLVPLKAVKLNSGEVTAAKLTPAIKATELTKFAFDDEDMVDAIGLTPINGAKGAKGATVAIKCTPATLATAVKLK